MMRLAILADIHSNLPALEAVFDDMSQFKVDQVVVAGDVVNWGVFSAQVMERVTAENCAIIRGNHEIYLTDWDTPRAPAHWKDLALPPFTIAQLGDKWMNRIAAWPDSLTLRYRNVPTVRVVHGSPRSHFESVLPTASEAELESLLAGIEETTLIVAHTHLAFERRVGRWHIINPGSVGNPIDGQLSASYCILESSADGWHCTHRRVQFDIARVLQEFERTRFIEQCGIIAHFVVEEYRSARPELLPFLEWWKATCPHEPHTMALLESYSKVDKQQYMPMAYRSNSS